MRAAPNLIAPLLIAGFIAAGSTAAAAQDMPALVTPGDAVVTGFSGATKAEQIEKRFIDLNGPSMQILSGNAGPISVSGIEGGNPAAKFQVAAGQVGQVFGIALDDNTVDGQKAPNIYLTATSLFGIQIVGPDADGDGEPDRLTKGGANATFMDGQFGLIEGAGPGTIYKVDGVTGEVTVFANITLDGKANSGPGLGNITFDAAHRQFLVADLDTGMIHRLDMQGKLVGAFDHGVTGRQAASLETVPHDDTARMDISSPAFSAEDTSTWGLAAPERRVIGLAVRDGRLFYSVNGAVKQIWSVGLDEDGSFSDDARLEIDAVGAEGAPMITDITFDSEGRIYLAQRGQQTSSFDYSVFAPSGDAKVMRYARSETGEGWSLEPQDYAIGMRPDHLEASGGVAIGNGPGNQSCRMLWSTGDTLQPKSVIHGIQGNNITLVRPRNVPPTKATFVDYDGQVNDGSTAGHVGDVEVLRQCAGAPAATPQPIPVVSPEPDEPEGGYLVPTHWKFGSSGGHSKCISMGHWKRRSHRKRWSHRKWHSRHGHWKRRSHRKLVSRGHRKRRSHWKCFSHHHRKRWSHWKHASRHFKRRSHWKRRSHFKRRSHWKHASRHFKHRSHWKRRSHFKRRSHWKHASRHFKHRSHWKRRSHFKRRSHRKHASRPHFKRRSHWKHASRHLKRRSHRKHASRPHFKRRSHWKHASRHMKRRSHRKHASRPHFKRRSHLRRASRGHHRTRVSRLRRRNDRRIRRLRPRRNRVHRIRRLNRGPVMRTPRFRPRGLGRRIR